MMTKVVNLFKDTYDTYIGRAGKGQDGYFGNPCVVGKLCPICNSIHQEAGATLSCFELYARLRILSDPIFRSRVKALKGQKLGCFCKPKPCHGDIYVILAEELN